MLRVGLLETKVTLNSWSIILERGEGAPLQGEKESKIIAKTKGFQFPPQFKTGVWEVTVHKHDLEKLHFPLFDNNVLKLQYITFFPHINLTSLKEKTYF